MMSHEQVDQMEDELGKALHSIERACQLSCGELQDTQGKREVWAAMQCALAHLNTAIHGTYLFRNAAIDGQEPSERQEEQAVAPVPDVVLRFHVLLRDQLGVNECQLSDDASFVDDLGADSLDLVEILMAVEEEFGICITVEEVENIKTVGQAVEYLKARGSDMHVDDGYGRL